MTEHNFSFKSPQEEIKIKNFTIKDFGSESHHIRSWLYPTDFFLFSFMSALNTVCLWIYDYSKCSCDIFYAVSEQQNQVLKMRNIILQDVVDDISAKKSAWSLLKMLFCKHNHLHFRDYTSVTQQLIPSSNTKAISIMHQPASCYSSYKKWHLCIPTDVDVVEITG